ncbi:hypothetical protein ACFYMW_31570 [Streptomyces sp. NPDC006692]|uniref:hypothetical protein n=1 Tax=Streptomyces sp. NPDC006692 TaxID=3364758 RepID=UPI0036862EB0
MRSKVDQSSAAGLIPKPHPGELAGPASVRVPIDVLGARRTAHGMRAVEDPDLAAHLAARKAWSSTSTLRCSLWPRLRSPLPEYRLSGWAESPRPGRATIASPSFPRCSLLYAKRPVLVRLWWPLLARHHGYLTSTWPPIGGGILSRCGCISKHWRTTGVLDALRRHGPHIHHGGVSPAPPAGCRVTNAHEMNPPIYAALVAEWWVRGRIVPGRHDAQWATLAAVPTNGTPDGVEFGIGTARWERVTVARAGAG